MRYWKIVIAETIVRQNICIIGANLYPMKFVVQNLQKYGIYEYQYGVSCW